MQINVKLDQGFTDQFYELSKKYGDEMRNLNGLSEGQLNFTEFIDHFVDKNSKNVADASIDGNSNVGTKDITSLINEMNKPHMKLLSFNKIYYEMRKQHGARKANEWLESEWNGRFYLHDSFNSSLVPYCYSYDLERVAKEGLFFVNDFNHEAPKHLVTFTDFVAEFVSWVSNRTSGGCSIPNYLVWSYYFWKHDVENGYFIRNPEYYRKQEFQRMIFKLNQPYLRITQSAYTTLSIMDEDYLVELFGGIEFPDGTLVIDHIEDIIEHEKVFMDVMRECHETNMMTFPVVSYALIFDYEKHRFKHEEFAKWCSDTNAKWMDCNFSIDDAVNALSSCCRLRNSLEINNLGNFSSIGGSALEVGSVKVNSINLARIAYECKDEDDYIAILEKRVALCCDVLQVIRSIITRNVEKGLLPNYTLGIIDVSKQYCTIGVNALFEAVRKMGYVQKDEFECTNYTDKGIEFAKRIFDTITRVKQEYTDKYGFLYNIEQIPGERAAAVFLQKDKILFPNEEYTSTLYSNQWISLSEKTTMHDKVEVGEQLDSYMGGGVISHYNFDSSFADKEQAWKLLNYIADHHIPYFAFNGKVNSCEHNHGFYEDVCPICGGKPVTTWTRVVGFCVPRKNMSKERRVEHDHRWWEDNRKFDFDSLM
jgi:ribonucleoside-triphosphate reductase